MTVSPMPSGCRTRVSPFLVSLKGPFGERTSTRRRLWPAQPARVFYPFRTADIVRRQRKEGGRAKRRKPVDGTEAAWDDPQITRMACALVEQSRGARSAKWPRRGKPAGDPLQKHAEAARPNATTESLSVTVLPSGRPERFRKAGARQRAATPQVRNLSTAPVDIRHPSWCPIKNGICTWP